MGSSDFGTGELDSIENVIGLSPSDPLNGFLGEILSIKTEVYNTPLQNINILQDFVRLIIHVILLLSLINIWKQ